MVPGGRAIFQVETDCPGIAWVGSTALANSQGVDESLGLSFLLTYYMLRSNITIYADSKLAPLPMGERHFS